MPANYEATKKAKLERSVSIDEAKYGAALWCLRSFEPLITKRIDSSNKFELVGFNISEDLKENVQKMIEDEILTIDTSGSTLVATVNASEIKFTQPFSKSEADYKKYEKLIEDSPKIGPDPSEKDIEESSMYWSSNKSCYSCVHFISMSGLPVGHDFEKNLCHLVKGFIDDLGSCKYSTASLIDESEDAKQSKANRLKTAKELRKD